MSTAFNGFSQQGLNFLQQVRIENDKEWFEANRQVYDQELLTPFRALVGKTLSRIHRDTRFSHDKSRYRSRMWLTFKRPSKDWKDAPVYFFELGPDLLRYGLGYYSANKQTMDLFRHTLHRQPELFLEVAECCRAPFELVGESYKRPLVKEQNPEIATWYNRKSFAVMATDLHVEKLFSPTLVDELAKGFQRLEPLYHWLMRVETLKQVDPADL
jgi:uncharacterized protein (DUF2461 family)